MSESNLNINMIAFDPMKPSKYKAISNLDQKKPFDIRLESPNLKKTLLQSAQRLSLMTGSQIKFSKISDLIFNEITENEKSIEFILKK